MKLIVAVFLALTVFIAVAAQDYPECISYPLGEPDCEDRRHINDEYTDSVYCCEEKSLRPATQRRRSPSGDIYIECHCYTVEQYCDKFWCP